MSVMASLMGSKGTTVSKGTGPGDAPKGDSTLVIVGCMMLNFWSAVLIIWTNKFVMLHGFRWASILTWMHFVASWVGLELCHRFFNVFEPKYVPTMSVGPLVCAFIAFVIFNNLSLQYNTVGVYQLLKVRGTRKNVLVVKK